MSGTKYQPDFELYQLTMATIRAGKRTDGSISNTAPIRLIREGAQVYQESQPFAREQTARRFLVRHIVLAPYDTGSRPMDPTQI